MMVYRCSFLKSKAQRCLDGKMGMKENDFNPDELIKLAQDKTVSAKNQLVENISDLFLSPSGRLNEHERALMNDILSKLIKSVEENVRKELSLRLSDSNNVSVELASLLANDNIEISRPILEKSRVLDDAQLIEIIRNRTDAHRMAIAIREFVSEDISSELIEQGNEDVIEALIRNENAEISELSMDYLVAESKTFDRFQEPLLSRHDIPSNLAYRMYWWVSAALRRKIITEFSVDETVLDDALEMSTKMAIQHHDETDNAMKKAVNLVRKMQSNSSLKVSFLLQSLRQEKVDLFVAGLAELSGLDTKIIWRSFRERTGESMAVIAKAIEMDREDFTSMFLLVVQSRSGAKARATNLLKSILTLFDDIEVKNAKMAVRHWQRDSGYQDAMIKVRETG